MSDFLENRHNYMTAQTPLVKGRLYFDRDGNVVKYHSTNDFDCFTWPDKPNPDGPFMRSRVYEKRPEVDSGSNCCFAPMIRNMTVCSKCKEPAQLVTSDK